MELDISQGTVEEIAPNRVAVRGAIGRAAPERLKVTASFEGSFLGEGEFSLAGPNCLARARLAREVLLQRLQMRKLPVRARIDLIGVASVHDDDGGHLAAAWTGAEPPENRVRLAAEGVSRDDVDQAAREVLAMLCCGPAGSSGARWGVTPRILTRSYLVPRHLVTTSVRVASARELSNQ